MAGFSALHRFAVVIDSPYPEGMAGPVASILSPKRLSNRDLQILFESLPGELTIRDSKGDEWVFRSVADKATQLQSEDASCFDILLDDLEKEGALGKALRSEEDFQAIEKALG